MYKNIDFIKELLKLRCNSEDATLKAVVSILPNNKKSLLLIFLKQGSVSYICCHIKSGLKVLSILDKIDVISYKIIKSCANLNLDKAKVPTTIEVIQKFSERLPASNEYYQAQFKLSGKNPQSNKYIPRNAKILKSRDTELILEDTLKLVYFALQKTLGPISKIIYDNALLKVTKMHSKKDVADLVNLILEDIADAGVEYQQEFLKNIAKILNIPLSDTRIATAKHPESILVGEDTLKLVYSALQKTLGPISKIIYDNALLKLIKIHSRKDIADLVNLIVGDIADAGVEYQQEFLNNISEPLSETLTISFATYQTNPKVSEEEGIIIKHSNKMGKISKAFKLMYQGLLSTMALSNQDGNRLGMETSKNLRADS